jgi:hypothetical protein
MLLIATVVPTTFGHDHNMETPWIKRSTNMARAAAPFSDHNLFRWRNTERFDSARTFRCENASGDANTPCAPDMTVWQHSPIDDMLWLILCHNRAP